MMLKRVSVVVLLIFCLGLLCGCDKENKATTNSGSSTTTTESTIVEDDFNESGTGELSCSTEAYAGEGIDVSLSYQITYKRGNILKLRSISKITSNDQDSLDEYETAYKNISDNYKGLKYYDVKLVRDSNTVVYDTTINYSEIDIEKLLDIEGEEDNIIENGKAKLSLWLKLAEKVGTTCEEV